MSGLRVTAVTPGGRAEAAGLEPGDWIILFNGRSPTTPAAFLAAIKAPAQAALTLVRKGAVERRVLEGGPPDFEVSAEAREMLEEVVITAIASGSLPEAAGLQVGDRIESVGGYVRGVEAALTRLRTGEGDIIVRRLGTRLRFPTPKFSDGLTLKMAPPTGTGATTLAVTSLLGGGPAAKAGLQQGDLVVEINGQVPPRSLTSLQLTRQASNTLIVRRGAELVALRCGRGPLGAQVSSADQPAPRALKTLHGLSLQESKSAASVLRWARWQVVAGMGYGVAYGIVEYFIDDPYADVPAEDYTFEVFTQSVTRWMPWDVLASTVLILTLAGFMFAAWKSLKPGRPITRPLTRLTMGWLTVGLLGLASTIEYWVTGPKYAYWLSVCVGLGVLIDTVNVLQRWCKELGGAYPDGTRYTKLLLLFGSVFPPLLLWAVYRYHKAAKRLETGLGEAFQSEQAKIFT